MHLSRLLPRACQRRLLALAGERLADASRVTGRLAARYLFRAQWQFGAPEWFDARLGLLWPEQWFTDGAQVSRANIVSALPLGGALLDLCGGDGFLPFYIYSRRAALVVSVDHDETAHRHALRHHAKSNIRYVHADLLAFDPGEAQFDVVAIRGAIEHFTAEDQQRIFRLAWRALKPGGWFCGDTPANREKGRRLLEHHHNEWADEAEMRAALQRVFPHVETSVFESYEATAFLNGAPKSPADVRTTLIWRCRKPADAVRS